MDIRDRDTTAKLDSVRLRALAHPMRSRLLGMLRREGPATATALAHRLGTNSGQTSYHLRQLADVGLVDEDTARGNGRERWWRAAHDATTWSSVQFRDDPEDRAADAWLTGFSARMHAQWTQDWLDTRDEWPEQWLEAAQLSDIWLRLTPDEAKALGDELLAVLERYRGPEDAAAEVPPGTETFTVVVHAFPHEGPGPHIAGDERDDASDGHTSGASGSGRHASGASGSGRHTS